MNEGPECLLMRDELRDTMKGSITNWVFSGGKYTEEDPSGFFSFSRSLPLTVKEIGCKGMLIYFILERDGDVQYIIHDKCDGRWQLTYDPYCVWFVELNNGVTLWYSCDSGTESLVFTDDREVVNRAIRRLGPSIMTREFTLNGLRDSVARNSNTTVASFITDQTIVSGCGPYLASEVLYYAKISPLRRVGTLGTAEIETLYEGLRVVPRLAYNYKGLSTAPSKRFTYYDTMHLKIYKKNRATCDMLEHQLAIYWDPEIQRRDDNSLKS